MKTMKCIHHTDLDGLCSAAIVNLRYPNIHNIPMDYNYPTPKIDENDIVIMVDVHLEPFSKMITIKKKAKLFIWIDHHKSAIEENNAADCTLLGLRREGTAACELTWECLMHSPVPKPVKLLGAYDVHNLSDQILHFQYGMRSFTRTQLKPSSNLWKALLTSDPESREAGIASIVDRGISVLTYVDNFYDEYLRKNGFTLKFKGYKAIAINIDKASSRIFDCVQNIDSFDILITFALNKQHEWCISLYSNNDSVDVSLIAGEYGGGGRRGAAGFTVKKLPFNIG